MDDDRDGQYVCLGRKLQGELGEGLQFPKLFVVEDRLNIIGFFLVSDQIQVHKVVNSYWF